MLDPLMEEIIAELEQASEKLSRLHKGIPAKLDNSETFFISQGGLSTIMENLNTVIRDLKKSIGRDS